MYTFGVDILKFATYWFLVVSFRVVGHTTTLKWTLLLTSVSKTWPPPLSGTVFIWGPSSKSPVWLPAFSCRIHRTTITGYPEYVSTPIFTHLVGTFRETATTKVPSKAPLKIPLVDRTIEPENKKKRSDVKILILNIYLIKNNKLLNKH